MLARRRPSSKRAEAPVADPLISYRAFDLIRDPTLLPTNRESEVATFLGIVEGYRRRLESLGVLQQMTARQKQEIAAAVLDVAVAYEWWSASSGRFPRLKHISKRGPAHVRLLIRKLQRAEASLAGIAHHARKVDATIAERVIPALDRAIAALQAARSALVPARETVDQYVDRMAKWHDLSKAQHPEPQDPRPIRAGQLFDYMREVCQLSASDAEVRIAKIGNAYWKWSYHISLNDLGVEGCPAVRMLLSRARRRNEERSGSKSKGRPKKVSPGRKKRTPLQNTR